MTHEIERAQYAEDVARLGPEAWRYWQMGFMDYARWVPCRLIILWEDCMQYRRNPATYPAARPVDANKTMEEL